MAIELDIEDIMASACLSSVGRAVATLSCLWMGAATGSLAVVVAEAATDVLAGSPPDLSKVVVRALILLAWGPLLMFTSILIPLFFPLVLLVYFHFGRGDGGTVKAWVVYCSVTGLLIFLSARPWTFLDLAGTALSGAMWVGFAGSLALLAFMLVAWRRRRLLQHLLQIESSNEQRRRKVAETFGTAVADREFATGEAGVWSAPADQEHPHPKVPRLGPPNRD